MVKVRQSTIIDAPVDEVWRLLRDFNGHDRWHPAIASSAIEGGEPVDAVGAVRRFRLKDGGELREQLLSLSDRDRRLTYCLLEAPLPLMGYVATVALKPVTDRDRTFWEWSSEFHPPAERREELVRLVTDGIYRAGFEAIRRLIGRPPAFGTLSQSAPAGDAGARHAPQAFSFSQDQKAIPTQGGAFISPPSTPPHKGEGRAFGASVARTGDVVRFGAAVDESPSPLWGGVRGGGIEPQGATQDRTRAIVVERHGGPEVLQLREVPLPPPGPGEAQVRHTAIGVNFIDIYCRTGFFDLLKPPGVPGMEAAGLVEALGPGVEDLAVGDRVAYAGPPLGAYSERTNRPAEMLVKLSDDIPDDLAAAGLLKGVTASFLLHDVFAVRPGHVVLVHAAAGGVGQLLVQWAKNLGGVVIATTSSETKARAVEKLGARHVLSYGRDGHFAEEVMRITGGRGADVVYDAVGKDTFAGSLAALAVRGHLVSFGQASGPVGDWDIGRFASKSVTVSRPNYGHYTDTPERLGPHVTRFFAALRAGIVSLAPPTRYPLERAADAHRDLEARVTTGSLVLVP
ncbi:SRPBCC family protein [Mesorhizobium sp. IMUNJ 23232]|uniref:SRPBCC family protein n=1 Tax=Mesorhizobium sp. IMUNJ 23232 TaxID=3376064 RepID=UPI00379C7D1E